VAEQAKSQPSIVAEKSFNGFSDWIVFLLIDDP
jgi:hypothetical protein